MGQYEPRDSRDVTLNKGHEPGGIERTGPREDKARRKAETEESDKMAIDNPAGDPRPEYDQYNLNDPEAIDKRDAEAVEDADEKDADRR
ncbi:hypothetical protein [Qipengyuania sp.]|uniref:hypothetical protein n=1 Tax=Qipengyuania sp. TaxID=2004515 RepID=UPI0035C7B717